MGLKTINIFVGPNTKIPSKNEIQTLVVLCDDSIVEEPNKVTSSDDLEEFEIIDILDKADIDR